MPPALHSIRRCPYADGLLFDVQHGARRLRCIVTQDALEGPLGAATRGDWEGALRRAEADVQRVLASLLANAAPAPILVLCDSHFAHLGRARSATASTRSDL